MIEMGIDHRLMDAVLRGDKVFEGRLRTSKFVTLRIGDHIALREDVWEEGGIASSKQKVATVVVTSTKFYDSFEDMIGHIGYERVLPDTADADTALDIYRQYYSIEQEQEYGVVAIGFKLQ